MYTYNKLSFLLLLIFLTFTSCKKDIIIDDEMIINPTPNLIVNSSVSGLVLGTNHEPLPNAIVRLGANERLTDMNGVFTFKNISINESGAVLTAEKEGYFYNAKFVRPSLNKMSFTKFKMLERTLSGTLAATSGGSVTTNGEARVIFPANAIKSEDGGGNYSGNVNVYARWIDPTGEDLLLEMPGDLRAMTIEDDQVQLTSFGMIGVELVGDGGEALNIADGQTATIEMPVPSTLLGSAPATIPLWHFDEVSGMWMEEGEATLQGDKYVGVVSHFSFWNCDVPSEFIDLSGTVLNESGGIEGLVVQVLDNSNGTSGFALTNEDGTFNGFVPNDATLTIIVFDNCGEELYNEEIGPFSEDTTLDPIVVPNILASSVTISGILIDCDMNPVTNGYVKVSYANTFSILQLTADGIFNSTISTCSVSEITVEGFDFNNVAESITASYNITGSNTLDIGSLEACEEIEGNYLVTTVDGVTHVHSGDSLEIRIDSVTAEIIIEKVTMYTPFYNTIAAVKSFATEINTPYTPSEFRAPAGENLNNTIVALCNEGTPCDGLTVTYSSLAYTNPGDIIKGQVSGTFVSVGGTTFTVSAQFKATKQ